jgi:hypothetical protein
MAKIRSILTFHLIFNLSSKIENCESWPENLPPLSDCCQLPPQKPTQAENVCAIECAVKSSDLDFNSHLLPSEELKKIKICLEDCFVKNSNIVTADKEINKTTAVRLFEVDNPYVAQKWMKKIEEAVNTCEFGTCESFTENYSEFLVCIDDFLLENCVEFSHQDSCFEVEKYFYESKNITPDCSVWPKDIDLKDLYACCPTRPEMINEKVIAACHDDCESKEFFQHFLRACTHNCLKAKRKFDFYKPFDFEIAKEMFKDNAK